MKTLCFLLSLISLVICLVAQLVLVVNFDRGAEGYLKRAADSNTIELAIGNMETALTYLEKRKMTEGYTSIFFSTPDEDVGFWFTNLESSLKELKSIDSNATQLEKTNVLMKLRETLLDSGNGSDSVTVPQGISKFPNNGLFAFWFILSLIVLVVSALFLDY